MTTVADLELLFTANTTDVAKAEKQIVDVRKKVESNPVKVGADPKDALAGMDRVEKEAKKLVSERAVVKLDADITRAEKNLGRAIDRLEDLHVRAEGGLDVTADVRRAETSIQRIERQLEGLRQARTKVDVEADISKAEAELEQIADTAADAGKDSGSSFVGSLDAATRGAGEKVGAAVGAGVEDTLVEALAAIPVAGGIILAGVAIGKAVTGAIRDGLNVERSFDRLQALTGLDEADAQRIGRAAGEAYANVFGESVEANMDTARLALQFNILDADATTRDSQLVIQGLAGIADVLDEDVRPTATAVATMLSTGIASSAKNAFDILAAGARNGLNRAEDLLDTFTEYPTLFQRLGLSGSEALGLINQGMQAGARNSDLVADALKELQIRSTDASESSAQGYALIGMNAEEMTAKMAAGGASAREGLAQILDGLRSIEDPVARNAAGVALVGTQWEDLGDAILALDLSTAVDQLDGVAGSAKRMFDTLADNDATKIEQAQRNIEVAADGIKGALAAAFSEPLGDFADWVSANRGPLTQFMLDLANGAIDFGRSTVEAAAAGTEAFGDFVAGPLADIVEGFKHVIKVMNPFADTSDLEGFINGMREFDDTTSDVADGMRDNLLPGLDLAQRKLNEWGEPIVQLGYVNDASLRLANAIDAVGLAADGSAISMQGIDAANLAASESGYLLEQQIRSAVGALSEQLNTAAAAGESQQNLTDRWNTATDALASQLMQMGFTEEQAWDLIAAYGAVPDQIHTALSADTEQAQFAVDQFVELNNGRRLMLHAGLDIEDPAGRYASGAIVEFMAAGGLRGLNPMAPLAQMVPPNTWRVVGDRSDVPELYAPLDGSARSWALLMEGFRRMPGAMPMADGGVLGPAAPGGSMSFQFGDITIGDETSAAELAAFIERVVRDALRQKYGNRGGL